VFNKVKVQTNKKKRKCTSICTILDIVLICCVINLFLN